MGAQILKIPEIQLSEAEAKKLDGAITDVMRFYTDFEMSPVVQAWLNLAMVGGVLYGPRFMAYNIRKKAQAKTIEGQRVNTPNVPANSIPQHPSNVTPIKPSSARPAESPKPATQPAQAAPALNLQDWSRWNAQTAAIPVSE